MLHSFDNFAVDFKVIMENSSGILVVSFVAGLDYILFLEVLVDLTFHYNV